MTLWSVARAPLIICAQLPLLPSDTWTLTLLTNAEVLSVQVCGPSTAMALLHFLSTALFCLQNASTGNAPIATLNNLTDQHSWVAVPDGNAESRYIALFNAADEAGLVQIAVSSAGLNQTAVYCARDLRGVWSPVASPWSRHVPAAAVLRNLGSAGTLVIIFVYSSRAVHCVRCCAWESGSVTGEFSTESAEVSRRGPIFFLPST